MASGAYARAKGLQWQRQVRSYLRDHEIPCLEPATESLGSDRGDVVCLNVPVTLQAKAWKNIAEAMNLGVPEAVAEATANGHMYGWAVLRRKGKPDPAQGLVVMELWQAAVLLRHLQKGTNYV